MTKVLVIGYEEIGDYKPNPAQGVAEALAGSEIGGAALVGRVLKCDSTKAPTQVREAIDSETPDIVIGLGVFPGAIGLSVERIAVNMLDFQFPDVGGNQWNGVPIRADGPPAYFASVPVKAMVKAMRQAGVPTKVSNSASTHMCNQTLYTELDHIATNGGQTRAGFIHLPNLPEFVAKRNEWGPTMSLETMVVGVRAGIEAAIVTAEDIDDNVEEWEW